MDTVIKIAGMSCQHCVNHVKNALMELDGVNVVSVSLEQESATVEYDAAVVGLEQFKQAIDDAGYAVIE